MHSSLSSYRECFLRVGTGVRDRCFETLALLWQGWMPSLEHLGHFSSSYLVGSGMELDNPRCTDRCLLRRSTTRRSSCIHHHHHHKQSCTLRTCMDSMLSHPRPRLYRWTRYRRSLKCQDNHLVAITNTNKGGGTTEKLKNDHGNETLTFP